MEKNKARDRMWGARLRGIRTQRCHLALEKAAQLAGWHGSRLSRVERGLLPVRIEDFATLLTVWGLDHDEREAVLEELVAGSTSGWWDKPIPGVPDDVGTLAGYESQARDLASVAVDVLPGLLHTYDTAKAIMGSSGVPASDVERRWMARLQRQQVLTKVTFKAYLTEQAVRTPWGGPEAWRGQLAHLLRTDEIGHQVRVIPAEQTEVVLLHSWHWMGFPNTTPVVHVELVSGATFVHEAEAYTDLLDRLDRVALPREGSRILIRELIEGARS
jgi:hypothetical protein